MCCVALSAPLAGNPMYFVLRIRMNRKQTQRKQATNYSIYYEGFKDEFRQLMKEDEAGACAGIPIATIEHSGVKTIIHVRAA